MITNYDDVKITPKEKAEEVLREAILTKIKYWVEDESIVGEMAQSEVDKVEAQLKKITNRLLKVLRYNPEY